MNGSQRETGTAAAGTIAEDLNVVLGRYQSWAAATNASASPVKVKVHPLPGAGRGKLAAGAREISYDQALRASRYGRRMDEAFPDPLPRKPAVAPEIADAGDPNRNSTAAAGREIALDAAEKPKPVGQEMSHAEADPAKTKGTSPYIPTAPQTPSLPKREKSSARGFDVPATAPDGMPQIRTPGKKRNSKNTAKKARASAEAGRPQSAAPVVAPAPNPTAGAIPVPNVSRRRPQPAFGAVLMGTPVLAPLPAVGSNFVAAGKSTCLTLRVSDVEQARIVACAAQAGVSVSAYLRQCALGVDELRDQVEGALSQLRKEQERTTPPPTLSAIPGILRRFGMKCLQRIGLSSKEPTTLAIGSR
jgi:hypothetical protein